MKITYIALALMLTSLSAHADPVLLGQWKSNRELTMNFANEYAKLEARQVRFLGQIIGEMTVKFSSRNVVSEMPELRIKTESNESDGVKFVGFKEVSSYKIIGTTRSQVAVSYLLPVTHERVITIYNFEDENTMWIYASSTLFPKENYREYFVRVQ
jgi:hypothetical protein